MSRELIISDELYDRLATEAQSRGLGSIERLLEEWRRKETDRAEREDVVRRIDNLRSRLFASYGEMPDSTDLVRQDRER